MQTSGDLLHTVTTQDLPPARVAFGRALIWGSFLVLLALAVLQSLHVLGYSSAGFENWRPVLYAYVAWAVCLCWGNVLAKGEPGKRALFVLPAVLFVVSMVVFPLLFGLMIAFSDWNLASLDGRKFNGLDNVRQMWADPFYWNALRNMIYYVLAIAGEYAVAFGLALLLSQQFRARKFFRIAFLMPLMLSPVAVSWMIGKSMMEVRFGPLSHLAQQFGWENPAFFANAFSGRTSIMLLDAWTWIPLMMVILLAGLQSLDKEVIEAARVDGASRWQTFREVIFPLMLPVSITAVLIRVIFKLKLADIIINVTSGGPGGATDSVTSFIYREYRDRSNVGYGTLLAMVYLVIIIVFVTLLIKFINRFLQRPM